MVRIVLAILLLASPVFGQGDIETEWIGNPDGYNKWQHPDFTNQFRLNTDPIPRNYEDSTGWHVIENDFHENGSGFYVSWNSLLQTTVVPISGEVLVTLNWNDVDYTVIQQLHSIKFFRRSDSVWFNIDDTPNWGNVSFDSNIVTWTGVFDGVDYRVQKDTARVNTGIFFKSGFLDSAVTLYNQRADSADIYLANVTAYTLSSNIDYYDSSLGNVRERDLKQLGHHVFQVGRQRLRFPGYQSVAEVPVWQRYKIVGGTLYVLEFVKMSAIKLIHITLPSATIWHNASVGPIQPGESADDGSIRWGGSQSLDTLNVLMWCGRSGAGDGMGSVTRFPNITIPKDAIIDVAWIDYKAFNAASGTVVNGVFQVEDNDDPATLTTYTNWNARNISAIEVAWNAIPAFAAATWYRSPELKTIIQVPINHADWDSGDAIATVLGDSSETSTDPSDFREIRQYDQAAADAAKLNIYYHTEENQEGGGGGTGHTPDNVYLDINWGTPDSARYNDNYCASYNNIGQNYLSLHDFDFEVPAGATIDSFDVTVQSRGAAIPAGKREYRVALTKDSTNVYGGDSLQVADNGGACSNAANETTIFPGTGWSSSEVNSRGCGVIIYDDDTTADEINIDAVWMTVYYTPAGIAGEVSPRRKKILTEVTR